MKLFKRHPSNDRFLGILFLITGPLLAFVSLQDGNAWGAFLGGVLIMGGIGAIGFWRKHEKIARIESENKELRKLLKLPPAT